MADLWVGPKEAFHTLARAVAASKAGDTIYVRAGTYRDESLSITHDLTIKSVGGIATFESTRDLANGKAILLTRGNVVLEGLEFGGATVPDHNGAGVRYLGGSLVVRNCIFRNDENGLLAADDPNGHIVLVGCEFDSNGVGDGKTHAVYVNKIASLAIDDCYFHDTDAGHHVKSRAAKTDITFSVFDDGNGDSSYAVDLPNGGDATLIWDWFHQSAASQNGAVLHYGGEPVALWPDSSLSVAAATVLNDRPSASFLANATSIRAQLADVTLFNLPQVASGPADLQRIVQKRGDGPAAHEAGWTPLDDASATAQRQDAARLYMATFGREPAFVEVSFWAEQLRQGQSLLDIAHAFGGSAEFAARFGGGSLAATVATLYRQALDRAPDPLGVAAWTDFIGTMQDGLAQALVGFATSAECRAKTADWLFDYG
jgi:hypothetical protein